MKAVVLAMKNAFSRLGFTCQIRSGGLRIKGRSCSAMIFVPARHSMAFDDDSVRSVDAVIFSASLQYQDTFWSQCPHFEDAPNVRPGHRPLTSIPILAAKSATRDRTPPASCSITCVFQKQMDKGVEIIRHEVFGTTSTYGVGKRVLAGTASSEDLEAYRQRLAKTIALLATHRVNCSFISFARHPFPRCFGLLEKARDLLESTEVTPNEAKNALSELQQCLSQPRGMQCPASM